MVDFWIEISIFIQKIWWLRSPNTDGDGWVCCVHSSGIVYDGVNNYVYYSYGRKNRRTRTTISIYGILDQMENIDLPRFIMMIPTDALRTEKLIIAVAL